MKWPSVRSIFFCFILLMVGGVVGWLLPIESPFVRSVIVDSRGSVIRDGSDNYPLISPILAWDIGQPDSFPELNPIKQSLQSVINSELKTKQTGEVSVYVRLLNSGKWFDINPSIAYAPASLLKVFIMTSYYKEDEDYPGVLDKQLVYEGSPNPITDDPGEVIPHLTSGKLYSVRDIIKQMIIYSDNDAFNTLVDNFDQHTLDAFNGIFTDLNIPSPASQKNQNIQFMSVSAYSTIFRVLYGATYLSSADSETALELLADAQYKDGIVAGVPEGTEVAHKFGVTTIAATATSSAKNELHDCGIVYYPSHPYLLCVMTQGNNFASLEQDLQDISKTTYAAMSSYYAGRPAAATSTPAK